MGYYIRLLATDPATLDEKELRECLPGTPQTELVVESKDENGRSQVMLRHLAGREIAVIERNPELKGELVDEEVEEFIEEAKHGKPDSAARWLEQYLQESKQFTHFSCCMELTSTTAGVLCTPCRIISGTGEVESCKLMVEDFSNESGYSILWQFAEHVEGDWNMARLDLSGRWISFEMELGNREQRAAFLQSILPKDVKSPSIV